MLKVHFLVHICKCMWVWYVCVVPQCMKLTRSKNDKAENIQAQQKNQWSMYFLQLCKPYSWSLFYRLYLILTIKIWFKSEINFGLCYKSLFCNGLLCRPLRWKLRLSWSRGCTACRTNRDPPWWRCWSTQATALTWGGQHELLMKTKRTSWSFLKADK